MSEVIVKPQQGVAKMPEVSSQTGQVGGGSGKASGGVYKHPVTGAEIIALDDPITGDAQARGFIRAGFEFHRELEDGDVKTVGLPSDDFSKQPERQAEASADELKGLRARLNQLEAAEAKRAEDAAKTDTAAETNQKSAQEAAEAKTDERGTDNSGDVANSGGVNAPVEALPVRRGRPANTKKEDEKE